MANPVNKVLMLYVNGAPTKYDSESLEVLYRSIGIKSEGGTLLKLSEVSGAWDFDAKNITNVGNVDGVDVSTLSTSVGGHIAGSSGNHAIADITGLTTALSGKSDTGHGHAISDTTGLQTALDNKVDENSAITGATKTKITYDAKGLVTAGADLADTDIPALAIAKTTGLQTALDSKVDENEAITGATKTKITYDAKGLVTAGADLADTDIPALAIAKTTGLQTALDGKVDDADYAAHVGGTADKHAISHITSLQTELDGKVDENAAITGATKTKITYDAKGLVTAGADLGESDIPALAISKTTGLQTALDSKVDENAAITGATKTKITYDAKGLVTAGADLADTDIPALAQSKITGLETALSTLSTFDSDLASTAANKGSKLVGFADPSSQFTATTVEAALDEALDAAQQVASDLSTLSGTVSGHTSTLSDLQSSDADKGADLVGFADPSNQFTATDVEGALDEALDAAQAAQSTANAALPKAGGTMSGAIAMGSQKITGLAAGTAAGDAVNKAQLDATGAGIDFQKDVLDVQVDDTLNPGATPTTGDRYIITVAASLHANFGTINKDWEGNTLALGNNDIVEYNGSEFRIRFDSSAHTGGGVLVWSAQDAKFFNYSAGVWSEFGALSGVTAGIGLDKEGNTMFVKLGAGIKEMPSDEIGIDLATDCGLELSSELTGGQLQVKLDGTALAKGSSGLKFGAGAAGNGLALEASGALGVRKAYAPFTNDATEIAAGALVYLKANGKIAICDADALSTCESFVGVAPAVIAADAVGALVQVAGEATILKTNNLVIGTPAFVSGTAGQTCKYADVPTASNSVEFKVGVATAIDKIVILTGIPIVKG